MSTTDGNMVGRVTQKVTLRKTEKGKTVGSLGIARKKIGSKDDSEFFYFDIWEQLAENCEKYTDAGALVNVFFRVYPRKEKILDSNNKEREITTYRLMATSVDFLVRAKDKADDSGPSRSYSRREEPSGPPDDDTSLPFDL